jgi:hypothetical protein
VVAVQPKHVVTLTEEYLDDAEVAEREDAAPTWITVGSRQEDALVSLECVHAPVDGPSVTIIRGSSCAFVRREDRRKVHAWVRGDLAVQRRLIVDG